jgi:hypothetical protein
MVASTEMDRCDTHGGGREHTTPRWSTVFGNGGVVETGEHACGGRQARTGQPASTQATPKIYTVAAGPKKYAAS